MDHSVGIIGGADGPTSIFVTSSPGWINLFGLVIVVGRLIPNIIYAIKHRGEPRPPVSKAALILENTGRYACMLLMVFNIGLLKFGFGSIIGLLIYLFGNFMLLLAYWICWISYFRKSSDEIALLLSVIPVLIFLVSGLALRHWLLVTAAVIFGAAHIYVTKQTDK